MAWQRKLGRPTDHRLAMLKNLVTSFLKHGKMVTTVTRAKETQSLAEKMITLAKKGDLHSRRQVAGFIKEKEVVKSLFDEVANKYQGRNGGYTRIVKIGPRRGDGSEMAVLELV